jgi:Cu(I)/Ag(I) efflux system membrane fusion protein
MDLIPASSGGAGAPLAARQIQLSPAAQALARVETAPVSRRFVESEIRMVGKIAYDATRMRDVSVRADGIVERLFVNYEGVRIRKGDHLAEIYSPDVLAAQKELLAAQRGDNIEGARQKLRLLGVLDEEIDAVLQSGEARRTFTLRSPIDGVLIRRSGNEGSGVNRGDTLARIADTSVVWALLDAYESDLAFTHYGQRVELDVEALPGRKVTGHVSFIPPEVDDATRTVKVRLNVPNTDGALKPGMFVRATLKARLTAEGQEISPELAGKWISPMHPEIVKDAPGTCDVCGMPLVPAVELGFISPAAVTSAPPLVIPASAPLLTGRRAIAYVAVPDQPGVFEGREVALGQRAGNEYIVLSGLREGEQVVVRGAMKIDSTLQLLGKPSMMNPGPGADADEAPTTVRADPERVGNFLAALDAYLALSAALAGDNLGEARAAAARLEREAADFPGIIRQAETIGRAQTLESARDAFEPLSRAVIAYARAYRDRIHAPLHVAFCPMAFSDKGAEWLQRKEEIFNPYFGDEMLHCGVIRETIHAGSAP